MRTKGLVMQWKSKMAIFLLIFFYVFVHSHFFLQPENFLDVDSNINYPHSNTENYFWTKQFYRNVENLHICPYYYFI